MESIKSYHLLPEKPDTSFQVKTMQDVYEKSAGKTDEPHRHDYYTILLVSHARGKHKIDFNTYDLAPLQVYFITPGQVHQVIEEEKSFGWIITFSNDFLIHNGINECFISDINLFRSVGDAHPLEINKNLYQKLEQYCLSMQACLGIQGKFSYEAVSAYLKLFLIECNNVCILPDNENQIVDASSELLRKFKLLVAKNYKTNHKVGAYADQLNITADYLNKVVKQTIGITAKEYIQDTLLLEIKRMLIHTELSSKEIGYELGFNDPSYFSNFFKKRTGHSLSTFKKINRY